MNQMQKPGDPNFASNLSSFEAFKKTFGKSNFRRFQSK